VVVAAPNEYVEMLAEQRTPELKCKWPEIRASVLETTNKLNES
jgi:hypothetical protein